MPIRYIEGERGLGASPEDMAFQAPVDEKTPEKKETSRLLHDVEFKLTGTVPEVTKKLIQMQKDSGEYPTSILKTGENEQTGENAIIAFFRRKDLECN